MRAIQKPENRYFVGQPGKINGGLGRIKLINALNESGALFSYIENRSDDRIPLKEGDEIVVFAAGTATTFTVLDDLEAADE